MTVIVSKQLESIESQKVFAKPLHAMTEFIYSIYVCRRDSFVDWAASIQCRELEQYIWGPVLSIAQSQQ